MNRFDRLSSSNHHASPIKCVPNLSNPIRIAPRIYESAGSTNQISLRASALEQPKVDRENSDLVIFHLYSPSTTAKYKNGPVSPPSFAPSLTFIFLLFLHYPMLSSCDDSFPDVSNSFPNDMDPSSSPSNNAISQPSGVLSNPVVQMTASRFVYSTLIP
jgi:hypothetical protein